MKKFLLLLLILPFLFFVSCPNDTNNNKKDKDTEEQQLTDAKYALSGLTAGEFFTQKGLTLGWNVGDSLDGKSETGWGNPRINKELFEGVTGAGFNVLRIRITWNQDVDRPIGPAPDYKLGKTRMERVVKVVDMAYDAGFAAVIINVHHDGAPNHDTASGDGMYWLNMNGGAEITTKFGKVWEQIATQFKDYGDWLIFEGLNEPRSSAGDWGWSSTDAHFTTINEWNQAFTDAVRGVGGNNTSRFLVIQPISARAHLVMDARFKLPNDPTPNKQIVSVHWYYPEAFSLNGSSFAWGTDADKEVIRIGSSNPNTGNVGFSNYKTKYTSQGIPMIVGECGATFQASRTGNDLDTAIESRIAYLTYLCEQAKANGLVPIIWDNGKIDNSKNRENFGLFNRDTGKPLTPTADAITAMVNAVK
jgi:hypothetical protein